MKLIRNIALAAAVAAIAPVATADVYQNDFSDAAQALNVVGRGKSEVADGVFRSQGNYAVFGADTLRNYSMQVRARAPKDAEQVQIWFGFRAGNRFDRYMVGMKGGLQDDIYLMRLGYMGNDQFMGVRPLGFHPEPGEWYDFRVDVCGNRMRVFVNGEDVPRLDITDPDGELAATGGVSLGGSWIVTEFDDLRIEPLADNAMSGVSDREYLPAVGPADKEQARREQRAAYQGVTVDALAGTRTEVSLDGDWLFLPDYQTTDMAAASDPAASDATWHVMNVPDFWNPIRIWLHGETMGTPRGHQPKGVSDTYYQQETDRCASYTFDYGRTKAAWYRQWIDLPETAQGKRITLTFDAISRGAKIFINGAEVANSLGMYSDVEVDATPYMRPGRNLVALYVVGRTDKSKERDLDFFYSSVRESETGDEGVEVKTDIIGDVPHGFYGDTPSGIWQPVKLAITGDVKVDDVYIKPALDGADFELTLSNTQKKTRKVDVFAQITDKATGAILYKGKVLSGVKAKQGKTELKFDIRDLKPRLWTPEEPNLYDFAFSVSEGGKEQDQYTVTSGFRTFEVKDGLFSLNGHPYWLRAGNHTPFALAPNDVNLANTFMQLMRRGNFNATRTHTTPWNQLWMDAADRNGIAVSFEGTWPWLFLHSTPIPDRRIVDFWADEWINLLKKYRNHPSLIIWTVNNEMKFYDNDDDLERAKEKYRIISDVVQRMRQADPTRPVCFDSNYQQKGKAAKYGQDFMDSIDDGDIDDMHGYYNWYDYSLFRFFNGEFEQRFKVPGRPLISQEMSTGYPNNETGHPTRSYQLIHQNPYTLVGYNHYDWCDPKYFLGTQAFITGELAEAFRRNGEQTSGIFHFALLTWFRQSYDYQNIDPYPTYYALKRALQPVLVSAELWGRHQYAGEKLATRVYVVNNRVESTDLQPTLLRWELVDEAGRCLTHGQKKIEAVPFYKHVYVDPEIVVPAELPADKVNARLNLYLTENGVPVSENTYQILLARRVEADAADFAGQSIALVAADNAAEIFAELEVPFTAYADVASALAKRPTQVVISGDKALTDAEISALTDYEVKGGKVLILNDNAAAQALHPGIIRSWLTPTEGDIVVMERNDHPVFDDIDDMELRYFNNNLREIPTACHTTVMVNRDPSLTELAGQMKIHAYIDGGKPADRLERISKMRGLTMFDVANGLGRTRVSTMATDKAHTDPIAARLLVNLLTK